MNKLLILFAKFIAITTVFTLLSCSFSNDAKPLPEEDDDETAVQPDTETEDSDKEESEQKDDSEFSDTDPNETDSEEPDAEPDDDPCLAPDAEKINSVVIGTYNTHMFFDTKCDSDSSGDCSKSDFESVPSNSEYKNKVRDLAESVNEIGADILLLQEVEKESCLKDLFEKAGGYDDFYLGETSRTSTYVSIDTGVMTKGKIISTNKHTEKIDCAGCEGGKTYFLRAFLETHIKLGCRDIIVFSAHFKSKNDDDSSRRLAEAAAAAKILKQTAEKYPDALIVMGGDLNDEPGSDTLEPFENDSSFLRVANELSSKNQATYLYHGNAIALDHIFWVKTGGGTYRKGSAEVVKDAPSQYSLGSSDHAALKAVFEF